MEIPLTDLVEPPTTRDSLAAEIDALESARETAAKLAPLVLPSEEAVFNRLREKTERKIAQATFESRIEVRGRLELLPLLRQTRGANVPRWFVYDPRRATSEIRWQPGAHVTFEQFASKKRTERIRFPLENPIRRWETFVAEPVLLPGRVHAKILEIREVFPSARPLILLEPRVVAAVEAKKPDPALLAEVAGVYYVLDLWEDPRMEDPRALGVMREFFLNTGHDQLGTR